MKHYIPDPVFLVFPVFFRFFLLFPLFSYFGAKNHLKIHKTGYFLLFGSILSPGSFWDGCWVPELVLSGSRSGFVDFKVVFSTKNGKKPEKTRKKRKKRTNRIREVLQPDSTGSGTQRPSQHDPGLNIDPKR